MTEDFEIDRIIDKLLDAQEQTEPEFESGGRNRKTREELVQEALDFGSAPIDDTGRMLIRCCKERKEFDASPDSGRYQGATKVVMPNPDHAVCGLFPQPSPSGGSPDMVCTGPVNCSGDNTHCPYSPGRFEDGGDVNQMF